MDVGRTRAAGPQHADAQATGRRERECGPDSDASASGSVLDIVRPPGRTSPRTALRGPRLDRRSLMHVQSRIAALLAFAAWMAGVPALAHHSVPGTFNVE